MTDTVVVGNTEELLDAVEDEQGAVVPGVESEQQQEQEPGQEPQTAEEKAELEGAADDAEREAIRERRRQERQDKKKYRQEKEDSYKREIDALRRQVAEMNEWKNTVEHRRVQSGIGQIDKALKDSYDAIEVAKQAIREATDTQNGQALVDAQELYYIARKRTEDLTSIKQRVSQQQQARPQQNIDPMVIKQAQGWMENKSWYDPAGKDPDSRIALTIDNTMAEEGWDPRSPEYWNELDERLKKYLPHRYAASYNASNNSSGRRSPTGGSSQGRSSSGNSEYRLSPERVRAMKEAGMWDDPSKRSRMIKRYMEQDKESKGN